MEKYWRLALVFIGVLLLAWWQTAAAQEGKLRVWFLAVGQGDAIYFRTPSGQDVLIDGGPDNAVLAELGRVMPFWDRKLELVVLTHPHADHVDGLVEILRRYETDKVVHSRTPSKAADYQAFLREIEKQKIAEVVIDKKTEIDFGDGARLAFLFPDSDLSQVAPKNLNNASLVAKLTYGEIDFLFTGDAEAEAERHLLAQGEDLAAEVLKVGHHGSRSSSTPEFLRAVAPEVAVISAGCENQFGHPHAETVNALAALPVRVLNTCPEGSIHLISDGQGWFY